MVVLVVFHFGDSSNRIFRIQIKKIIKQKKIKGWCGDGDGGGRKGVRRVTDGMEKDKWGSAVQSVGGTYLKFYPCAHVPMCHVWPKKLLSFSSEAAVAVANKKQKNLPRRQLCMWDPDMPIGWSDLTRQTENKKSSSSSSDFQEELEGSDHLPQHHPYLGTSGLVLLACSGRRWIINNTTTKTHSWPCPRAWYEQRARHSSMESYTTLDSVPSILGVGSAPLLY